MRRERRDRILDSLSDKLLLLPLPPHYFYITTTPRSRFHPQLYYKGSRHCILHYITYRISFHTLSQVMGKNGE